MKLDNKVNIKSYINELGSLYPLTLEEIPYEIKRIFWASNVPAGETRGCHAHINCLQTYVCAKGKIQINSDDGVEKDSLILNEGDAVTIPPLLWTSETYLTGEKDILLVLCSEKYEPSDYIHTIEDLIKYKESQRQRICLLGSGNLSKEVISFFDDQEFDCCMEPEPKASMIYNIPNLPVREFRKNLDIGILSVQNPSTKEGIIKELKGNDNYKTIIHNSSLVSTQKTSIGTGCVVCPKSLISCNVNIGNFVTVDRGSQIGHDSSMGDFSTLAPDVTVSGNVKIGKRVFVGTKSSIKDGVNICDDVIIGMGSAVINNITEPGVYAGVPAKKINK